jgi:acyl-CoA reductase-like NAD-dependent aldehyde dehydrogenase
MSSFASELSAARGAQQAWSRLPVRERLRPVRRLRALLVERTDDLFAAVNADIGRPLVEVVGSELLPTAAALKFLEQRAARLLAPRRVGWSLRPTWLLGCRDAVHRRPWGVVGIIGTWNYPIYLNTVQAAQALVAGNAVLWKPSENAPRTADLTHALFLEAGFPRDLFRKLPATREAGPQLADAGVDHIVFTGSDAVGRKLAARLGERLVPSTLELSGCDAMFVLSDANVELAARAAWFGLTLNRGQTCIAVRRIFVQRAKYAAFADELRKLVAGAGPMELVTSGQLDGAQKLIDDAVKKGASLLPSPLAGEGGERVTRSAMSEPGEGLPADCDELSTPHPPRGVGRWPPGSAPSPARGEGEDRSRLTVVPTFLLDVPVDSLICREACFAPVAAVIPFDAIDNAVSQSNQSPFALAASIFTADTTAAQELAARMPAGHVSINDVLAPTAHPATPFGGRGASGWGVTQGAEGLLAMTVPQAVTVRKGTFRPHFDEAVKPDPATLELLRGLLRWTHARGLREKLRGLREMIRGVRKKK